MPEQSAPVSLITSLVARFEMHREAYLGGRYNETQLRREFIDPMWKALGWDIDNEQGYAEAYKDVIHEDAIKVSADTYTKAPDYCFRIGGVRKYFLEAKKPSVDIKDDPAPAYQLRRYAWSAKMPLSVLTDFEELAVYDTRVKPASSDKASKARTLLIRYTEYAERWDEIAAIFSRDAVLKGSFDKYAESSKAKRGTAAVDEAFLEEIEGWREELARNLALRNPSLSQRELNFAVQATIDRIVFLRITEDRGIEPYGQLLGLTNGANTYARLFEVFQQADERYNSGLFHFSRERGRHGDPDDLTPALEIDDKQLKDIIRSLYYPDSPYEFSVLSADILGQVYEQFLGKIIRLTSGHRAVIEEKPEVKKAGGVFYTPRYIVAFIVEATLGKLLEGKTPKDVAGGKRNGPLRVLDPACGSGSFLLGAYQYLLDWHRDWYISDGAEKYAKGKKPRLHQVSIDGGGWRLTTAERKRLLLTHIYGVDIDEQAVEVTKLSLLLKVLEGESDQTLTKQLQLFRERALPDLGENIKSGNSLVGSDFYDQQELGIANGDERYRVNAFDWEAEFTQVFSGPDAGFDAVIGNPPYIRMELFKELKDYFRAKYSAHDERSDLYAYFVERAHKLLSHRGRFAMILSNKFLRANYGQPLRQFLRDNATVEQVVDLAGLPVFRGATVRTLILATTPKRGREPDIAYAPPVTSEVFDSVVASTLSLTEGIRGTGYEVASASLDSTAWSFAEQSSDDLLRRLKARHTPLKQYCNGQVLMGVKTGLTDAFVIDETTRNAIVRRNARAEEIIKPFLNGRDVRRYHVDSKHHYLIYTFHGVDIDRYPAVKKHLEPFKDRLQQRATNQAWYELQQPQLNFAKHMDGPKIIFPDIATAPRFAIDAGGHYGSNTTYFIPGADRYLLGLLNSRLAHFYFALTCAGLESKNETYLRFFGQYLEGFPVRTIDADDQPAVQKRESVVNLVGRMLDLHGRLAGVRAPHERQTLEREIDATDKQLDASVYELYDLTPDEVALVESATE